MASSHHNSDPHRQSANHPHPRATPRPGSARRPNVSFDQRNPDDQWKGTPLDKILDRCRAPPIINAMENIDKKDNTFLILPFKYNPSTANRSPEAVNSGRGYVDQWDKKHVHMPCSPKLTDKDKKPKWQRTSELLRDLRTKCNAKKATMEDLKTTIQGCAEHRYSLECLEILINQVYSSKERSYFLSTVLSDICNLAIHVDDICSRPPPLLHAGKRHSVTMSQKQAASLLACAFFCLFPYRSEQDQSNDYKNFPDPNFCRLYQRGSQEKVQKLRCILHYFHRITEKTPGGVISFRRYVLSKENYPDWARSPASLSEVHLTTEKKIEDISCALQVDFANKYIGGGVLGNGCVQEEIRFSVCPEMLVSLLVCEMMEPNECIFVVGCARYCSYDGYAGSFKFAGNYNDQTHRDSWGRKWCHLVAIDALFFRDPNEQYEMKLVTRELTKAYAGFRPRPTTMGAENLFGIATGHWGCGAFHGDKQLKAIIQLMAASEAQRPLIYAAYHDQNFVNNFADVHEFLIRQKATVSDLYHYIKHYCNLHTRDPLFEYILSHPILPDKL